MMTYDERLEKKLEKMLSEPFVGVSTTKTFASGLSLTTVFTLGGCYDMWVDGNGEIFDIQ